MAKAKIESAGARQNRIRFVMLEADLSDGNLNELAQAITNALKPSVAPQRIAAPAAPHRPPAVLHGNGDAAVETAAETEDEPESDDEGVETATAAQPRAKGAKRKLPTPDYLSELFADETKRNSFVQFAKEHPTTKQAERYLVAANWLKDNGHPNVNMNMMYTCYRTASWPMTFTDWDVNFRNHVGQTDRMERVAPGEYKITPLGEEAVRKLKTQ